VKTVSGRLGYANATTTLGVFAHFLEAADEEAAAHLGATLDAASTRVPRGDSRLGPDCLS
jgi:hypothetical protein